MQLSCVLSATELTGQKPDIILFPELVAPAELLAAQTALPTALVAGAIEEDGRCRGLMVHGGVERISYLKVGSDGRSEPCEAPEHLPVYRIGDLEIGLLVCMDVDEPLGRAVRSHLSNSNAAMKLLLVPADMAGHWFSGDQLPAWYAGFHVAVCNNTLTHGSDRCKSFVASPSGSKRVVQHATEPIHVTLPL